MAKLKYLSNLLALAWDLALVYLAFTICRIAFCLTNIKAYGNITAGHYAELFGAGLIFDTSAILYANALIIALMLLPLPQKERPGYYTVVRWIFTVVNSLCVCMNLADCVYFQFTGKRTTISVLSEFGHEGGGEMLKIFCQQLVAHWPLALLAAAICYSLWRFFRSPLPYSRLAGQHWVKYVAANVLALALAVPFCIAGMRGGFTMATRPITVSNANQYVNNPAETGIVLNTPFAVLRTMGKRVFEVPDYITDEEAFAVYTPVHEPADTAAFRPMNVVVLIVESFGKQNFGFYNKQLRQGSFDGYTPFLDSLIENSALTYKYSYSNGRKSIEGMPSTLSSLPNFVEPLFLTPASLNKMSGLARELSENKGYQSAFFHGAMNGSMGFEAFARATGFQRYYGRTEYGQDPKYGGDKDFDGTWAIWDEEFLQFYCDRMSQMQQPFMTAVFTATSHTPYALPKRYDGVFPKGEHPLQTCVAYTDNALRLFFESASRQPWFENTLFVITADHTSQPIDPEYFTTLGQASVPIIFYAPADSTLHGYDTVTIAEQIDIMPTVLGYLNYDKPYIAFGRDLLNGSADDSFALHWLPESSAYEYVSGDYAIRFDGNRVTDAYRFRTDSLMTDNVLGSMPADTLQAMETRMKSIIRQYMQRMVGDSLVIRPRQ